MQDAIEAKARELHAERKANTARHRGQHIADLMTFDGGERDFCLAEAKGRIEDEAYRAEVAAQRIASMAHMSDTDIADQIAEIAERRSEPSYCLAVSMASQRKDLDLLTTLRGEFHRRQLVAMQAEHNEGRVGATPISVEPLVNLLDAVRAAGLRDTPVTLDNVAALVCADIAASYAESIRANDDTARIAAE